MLSVPVGAYVASGCLLIYVAFLAFVSFPPSWVPSTSYGVYYQPIGNLFSSGGSNQTNPDDDNWTTCQLPQYDVWDEEIIPYFNPNDNPLKDCNRSFTPLTELKNGKWAVVNKDKELKCRARCHERKAERSNKVGNWTEESGPMNCEIVESVCSKDKKDVYGYLHSQIVKTPPNTPKVDVKNMSQYNVYVILLDSLSYTQSKRALPRTLSYFTNHMDGVIFPYINKIGENSRPNGMAVWFGKSLENIDRSLFDEGVVQADWNIKYFCRVYKDNETFLLNEYKDYGYKTLLAEDWAAGTINWPNCVGFEKQPTDHYMRPFQNAYEGKAEAITKKHLDGKLCREYHHTLLDYMQQFIEAYPDEKKIAWLWITVLGHNTENGIVHSDKDFHNYLLKNRKELDNSFVFILGDHGLRFGGVLETAVGALDVNNPLTAVSIPKALRKTTNILETMKENAKKLQTHYDTRATLLDILKYQSKSNFTETEPLFIPGEKGFSYIRKQPETPRNCRTLPIPLEYCICHFNSTVQEKTSEVSTKIGISIADAVNEQINQGLFTDRCIKMLYKKTRSLHKYDHQFKGSTLYVAVVEMEEPSNAVYKANIKIFPNGTVNVLGTVERNNKYGKTADCIPTEFFRPYCYCKNQTKTRRAKKG